MVFMLKEDRQFARGCVMSNCETKALLGGSRGSWVGALDAIGGWVGAAMAERPFAMGGAC